MSTLFVCNMNALTPDERARHGALAAQLHPHVTRFDELPQGYAARLPAQPELAPALTEFVTLERRCCPFLTLAIRFEPHDGPLALEITGPPGAKPFIRAEFGIPEDPT